MAEQPDAKLSSSPPSTEATQALDPARTASFSTLDVDGEQTGTQPTKPTVESPGDVLPLIPNYELLGVIGRGGMGIVIKARDLKLNRLVAIKLPLKNHIASAADRTRFLREAQSAAKLEHANICAIHAVGEVEDRPYIAMTYVEGDNLDRWASASQRSPHDVARMVAVLAKAVGYAHEQKVIHRDLKPSNVLVSARTRQPVLMDFGLAKEIGEQQVEMTQSGQIMGTPAYMAPEQAAGDIRRIGPPADIYALGAILYKLLTGKQVFESKVGVGELLKKVQTEEPPPPRSIQPAIHVDLETICLKCLAKEPEGRYRSANELADDLIRFTNGEAILARREGVLRKIGRRLRKNRVASAAFAASIVALAFVAIWFVRFREEQAQRNQEEAIKQLEQEFETELSAVNWDEPDAVGRIDQRVKAIEEKNPQRGSAARGKVAESLFASANRLLDRGHLDDQVRAQVTRVIALLDGRDQSDLASQLRLKYRDRERGWISALQLRTPFANLDQVFDGKSGKVELESQRCLVRDFARGGDVSAVLTTHRVRGNLQVAFEAGANWQEGRRIGIVLNHPLEQTDQPAYYCLLSTTPWGERPNPERWPTFAEARRNGTVFHAIVARGKVRLADFQILPTALPPGPLKLFAQRENETVTFQVNQGKPLIVNDMFPLPARGGTGLVLERGGEIAALEIREHAAPASASPLEQGDEHFNAGRFQEAARFYQAQAVASAGTPDAELARLKEAIALYSLARWQDAVPILEEIIGRPDRRRATLAACYRIAVAIQEKQIERATQLLQALIGEQETAGGQIASLLPDDVRGVILGAYRLSATGLRLLIPDPDRVANMKLYMLAEQALGVPMDNHGYTRIAYLRSLRTSTDPRHLDEAIAQVKIWLKEFPVEDTQFGVLLTNEYGWLMREIGRPEVALAELDSRLFSGGNVRSDGVAPLLVERSRLLIAREQWEEAEKNLETYLARVPNHGFGFRPTGDAALILGFLRERRGDAKGAQEIWLGSTFKGDYRFSELSDRSSGMLSFFNTAFLGFLTNSIKQADLESLLRTLMQSLEYGNLALSYLNRKEIDGVTGTMLKLGRTPEFKEYIRQFAFQSIGFRACLDKPIRLFGIFAISDLLFDGKASDDQMNLTRQFVDDFLTAGFAGRLNSKQGFKTVNILRGNNDFFGWKSLAPSMEPTLRGPAAYLFGLRYLQLNRARDAAVFFTDALKDAQPDSLLQRLANESLQPLSKK